MKTLIYDLLVTEAWKDKVYPLIKDKVAKSSVRSYMAVSYSYTVVINFLIRFTMSLRSRTF